MENKMEEKCYCSYFEKRGISSEEIFKKFHVLSSSESNNSHSLQKGEFTSLLKCSKCNSYYLMNACDSSNSNNYNLPIRKYFPKVDETGLIKTLKSLEGIITGKELDYYSEFRLIIKNILIEKRNKERKNENLN
jgi:hypothetical protein